LKNMLPDQRTDETTASDDRQDSEASRRAAQPCTNELRSTRLKAYLEQLFSGESDLPNRPDISCLGEDSLLRIEAGVLEIMVKARPKIHHDIDILSRDEEGIETYEELLNSDEGNAAKWFTDQLFLAYLGQPIFSLIADECLLTVARTDMPNCLESAARFAQAHMPTDENYIPRLRLNDFKLYLAKALRRDARAEKHDVEHQQTSALTTQNTSKSDAEPSGDVAVENEIEQQGDSDSLEECNGEDGVLASDFTTKEGRQRALTLYCASHDHCSEAAFARTAGVHPADLSKWKQGLLPCKSDKKARIQNILKGSRSQAATPQK
jgi:hypothetical protein